MSTPINDGGRAFSQATFITPNGDIFWGESGMTMRDYFAGKALAGLLASGEDSIDAETNAHDAYIIADAMIATRKKARK